MENPIFRPLDSLILGGIVWQNNKSSLLSEAFAQENLFVSNRSYFLITPVPRTGVQGSHIIPVLANWLNSNLWISAVHRSLKRLPPSEVYTGR